MFLSAVWSNSDGIHSLQMIHRWTSDGKFISICSHEELILT